MWEWEKALRKTPKDELSARARSTLMALRSFADEDGSKMHPSYQGLADMMGVRRSTAIEGVRELEQRGWVARRRTKINGRQATIFEPRLPEVIHEVSPASSTEQAEPPLKTGPPVSSRPVHRSQPDHYQTTTDKEASAREYGRPTAAEQTRALAEELVFMVVNLLGVREQWLSEDTPRDLIEAVEQQLKQGVDRQTLYKRMRERPERLRRPVETWTGLLINRARRPHDSEKPQEPWTEDDYRAAEGWGYDAGHAAGQTDKEAQAQPSHDSSVGAEETPRDPAPMPASEFDRQSSQKFDAIVRELADELVMPR